MAEQDLQACEAHGTPTRLRCAEEGCGTPICPQCLVKTPVGLKCEEHAQAIAPRLDRRVAPFALGALVLVAAAVVILALAVLSQDDGPTQAADDTPAPAADPTGNQGRIVPASVHVINADGTLPRTLTNRPLAFDASPAWSSDGARIAFDSTVEGRRAIWVMQADGQGLRRLTDGGAQSSPGSDASPAWSPDGARLAFVSDRDGEPAIWAMFADGSVPTRLVPGPAAPGRPAWSPQGRQIAFASDRDGGDLDIWVAPTTDGGPPPTRIVTSPGQDGEPAWSPDGSRIAFASDRDGAPEVYVAAAHDGSNPVKLTSKPRSFAPAWAPDGSKLVYINDPVPGG